MTDGACHQAADTRQMTQYTSTEREKGRAGSDG